MQPCPGNGVAIERAVYILPELLTHLLQEFNVGTVPTLRSRTSDVA